MKGKKAPPSYVANVDFLIATNPILAILETWSNNNPGANVAYSSQDFTLALHVAPYTVTDANFLAVVAVTMFVDYDVNFNDYGGVPQHLTGTFEVPLVNSFILGPDPSQPASFRRMPYCYRWNPNSGPTVYFEAAESGLGSGTWGKTIRVYYAAVSPINPASQGKSKKNTKGGTTTPLGRVALTFEDELGNGPEFNDFESKRVVYPMFAGAGSDSYNCGASGTIDKVNVEVLGKFAIYPSGDADFADMIEDIVKSGPLQAGYGSSQSLGDLQHGVNCYDYPLVVQQRYCAALEDASGLGVQTPSLGQPLQAGDKVLVMQLMRDGLFSDMYTPTDTHGNTYNLIDGGNVALAPGGGSVAWPFGLWYADITVDQPSPTFIGVDHSFNNQVMIAVLRGGGVSGSPLSSHFVFDNATVTLGTDGAAQQVDASITTTQDGGNDALIVAWTAAGSWDISGTTSEWKTLFPGTDSSFSLIRRVTHPGTYKVSGVKAGGLSGNPCITVLMSFKSTQPRGVAASLGNIIDDESLDLVRTQCRAYGLWGSLVMASQQAALEWLKLFGDDGSEQNGGFIGAANMAYFWSGFRLKFFPYAEASKVGNGAIYVSPTAAGPIADLDVSKGDFKWATDQMPVTQERTPQMEDAPNIFQFQIPCRSSSYNQVVVSQPLAGATARFGPRKDSPKALDCVVDPTVARKLLMVRARRASLDRNRYPITIDARGQLYEPGDLITITDEEMGIVKMPVRFVSLEEDPKTLDFKCVMSRFIYGMCSPDAVIGSDPIGSGGDRTGDPGSVNAPIIFQPVPRLLANQSQPELWIVVSGGSLHYGGCEVLLSTDGGTSYHIVGILIGNPVTGWLTADWPAAADPDSTHALSLDVSESRGVVARHSVSDEDNFIYPFYVDNGGTFITVEDAGTPIAVLGAIADGGVTVADNITELQDAGVPIAEADPTGSTSPPSLVYELGSYADATLTAPYQYTIPIGGGKYIRRAVFDAPIPGTGVDHPLGSRFAILNPLGVGILKLALDSRWIGVDLKIKCCAFNEFGMNGEDPSDVTVYDYTPVSQGISAPDPWGGH